MLEAMRPQMAEAMATYRQVAPQMRAALDYCATVAAQIRESAQFVHKELTESARQALAWYREEARQLGPVLKRIGEEYAALERSTDRAVVPILKKRRWFGLERYFTPWEFHQLIAAYGKGKAKAADKYVCARFSQNRFRRLNTLTRPWWRIAYMQKRKPKVRMALKAYRNRQYALVIPILLTFADGLAHAYFRVNPANLAPTKSGKKPAVLVPQAASHYSARRPDYAGLLAAVIADGLYKSYAFGVERPPLAVNRHGVLHGDTIGYDTEANALRTILLLDSICRVALAGPRVP